ncbi:MAG: hypothetical protein A3C50_03645 [Candidatus Staskawiczbacteria bacterium RIFCSPHIGHO2_02_FULL_43_16]|uniref:DUF5667 domain-containing protein n=1 Tax=Candidatus Staskawiczbacteria bacterium RIFCSPHIGHO2_01_FULL_41_41 TaxID=1802203 RepID=A0A1G2HSF4_9BACT|nr:MAG: hypothetical protein A2822_02750 [Candidatus Staskawiczbacteria bacterium RIFCSPHIGHO2_01_FULL_41_41]OGZ68030.1 MAG: hypothetical protein A3C50_03645 [Candidatus Staskawiczbacteria bacterium RIFCSPHIGHO2_02_FULL_43_16]OGZ74596.1 MAG: hypothetical protein A3A12_02445 [Candidatus Staskawiczbacteria bacterium RIFCSPLOWO2_01_FULL_43_17b]
MQEQELITKLKELKNISPRKEWVILSKIQILDSRNHAEIYAQKRGIAAGLQGLLGMVFQRKFAYAYAALAILLVGSVGIMQFDLLGNQGVQVASQAAIIEAKSNVEVFKEKSKELAITAKSDPVAVSLAVDNVKAAAKQLTEIIKKDPGVAKEIALEINNNKTYLDVQGSAELKATSNDLYKTVAEQMIKDLEATSLTESQQEALDIAKELYDKERYTDALESILLLSMAIKSN